MPTRSLTQDDPLEDFVRREITLAAVTKVVLVSGEGPAVIVMPELPGISPHVARFARWVRDAGFTVHLPSLFGRDGAVADAEGGREVFQRACVSAEFRAFAAVAEGVWGGASEGAQGGVSGGASGGLPGGASEGACGRSSARSSPVTAWLRALARLAHEECGGPGVGAIGMCFTGNFALTMMLEPAMLAPVLAQPSLPLDDPAGLDITRDELAAVRQRLERDDLTVMAYRFKGDRFCRAQRFAAYAEALGDRFVPRVLPDSAAGRDVPPFFEQYVASPHSVVTVHLVDEAGQPTVAARDEILAFFARRLAKGAR